MCGRYRLTSRELAIALASGEVKFIEFSELKIDPFKSNSAADFRPSGDVPMIRLENGQPVTDLATWGFVRPGGAGTDRPQINARGETVARLPMFRDAFRASRCLLPTDGFYEPKGPKGMKNRPQFYFRRPDGRPFMMAGIYTRAAEGFTVALITIFPNPMMAAIHDRMPVILEPQSYAKWLNPQTPTGELQALLKPAPDDFLIVEAPTLPLHNEPTLFD